MTPSRRLIFAAACLLVIGTAVWCSVHAAEPTRAQVNAAVDPAFSARHVSLGLLALAAAADVITTEQGLHRGCHEANPIYGPHPSTAMLVATHGALVGIAWYGRTPAWANIAVASLLTVVSIHNAHCGR